MERPPRDSGSSGAHRAERVDDDQTRCSRARALLAGAPEEALTSASDVLDGVALDSPAARDAVITMAEALTALGRSAELAQLVELCGARYASSATLHYLAGIAYGQLGRLAEMVGAFEECLRLGEDAEGARVVGAGSFLPLFRLGILAETSGDRATARTFYARARVACPSFDAPRERLEALDARARAAPGLPARLLDNDAVAMKECRHGTFTYPALDQFVGRSLDLYGEWCEPELETLGALLGAGDTVVDVGANIGTHTVYFARKVGPGGRVIAVEPQAFAYGLLAANVAQNGLGNVTLVRAAAGAEPGTAQVPIVDPKRARNFGAVAVGADGRGATEAVPATTIDALELPACAVLKIDVEGMEVEVLAGARRTIERCKPVVFVENNTVARSAEVLAAVRALGYRAYWHIAPYYRPDNHFGNPEDVFAAYQPEANLVCVPAGRSLPGMLEVEGPDDDFVKALGRARAMKSRRVVGPAPATEPAAPRRPKAAGPAAARPLTVVACIPGREFSGRFFDAWNTFAEKCRHAGVNLVLSRHYDAVVYYARNKVAGGDVRRGPKQAPWGGELTYDYMLWIDSDVVFRFEDFQALLAHKVDLVAGLYLMADNARYAAVETMDESRFAERGEFDFLTPERLEGRQGLVRVDYCGFGFVLARRGVFERLDYPWFRPVYVELAGGMREFTSEDVGFCMMAKAAGIPMYVDPNVVVGHEKAVVLAPSRRAA